MTSDDPIMKKWSAEAKKAEQRMKGRALNMHTEKTNTKAKKPIQEDSERLFRESLPERAAYDPNSNIPKPKR